MKAWFKGIMITAATAIAGCVVTFHPQEHGPKAWLSERDPLIANVAVYEEAIECRKPRALYGLLDKSTRFVPIPANKPLTLRVVTHSNGLMDPAFDNVTFIPEEGQKYTVSSNWNHSNSIPQVQIFKVQRLGRKVNYIPIHYLQRSGGFWAECNDEQMKDNIKKISTLYQK